VWGVTGNPAAHIEIQSEDYPNLVAFIFVLEVLSFMYKEFGLLE
jgi:hypothetical protein